jgi:thioesterase domain-containing protein
MTDRLPDYMVPSAFVVLQELPRLANGKVDRHALAEREWEPTDEVRLPTPPSDEIEHRLVRIWEDLLGTRPIGTDDDFFDIGGHSLLAIRLIARIREAFDEELPAWSILEERTIARMACLLRARTRPDSPLIVLQPRGAERPLFCVHALSGTAFPYVELARRFDHERPVYALQARATDAGEPFPRIEDMAASYLDAVRSAQKDGPYLLAGWSMGGLVAVAMARQLEAEGREVALVALLDTLVPGASADGAVNHHALAAEFARTLGIDPDRLASWFTGDLWQLGTDEQLESLFELARGANLVPQNLGLAALRGQLRLFAQNLRAAHDHVVTPCAAPLALFTADESPLGGATALADWQRIAPHRVTRYRTAGDHDTMLRQPHVRGLSRQLRLVLRDAEARYGEMGRYATS